MWRQHPAALILGFVRIKMLTTPAEEVVFGIAVAPKNPPPSEGKWCHFSFLRFHLLHFLLRLRRCVSLPNRAKKFHIPPFSFSCCWLFDYLFSLPQLLFPDPLGWGLLENQPLFYQRRRHASWRALHSFGVWVKTTDHTVTPKRLCLTLGFTINSLKGYLTHIFNFGSPPCRPAVVFLFPSLFYLILHSTFCCLKKRRNSLLEAALLQKKKKEVICLPFSAPSLSLDDLFDCIAALSSSFGAVRPT